LTFQVALVGSDGVLLASDLKRTNAPPGVCRSSSEQPKIHISQSGDIAYCCSGDDLAEAAARRLCEHANQLSNDQEISAGLISAAQEAIKVENSEQARPLQGRGNSVLLALREEREKVKLWCLDIGQHVTAMPVYDKRVNGDRGNAAGYFLERYFPTRRRIPIQKLLRLAAHTVLQDIARSLELNT